MAGEEIGVNMRAKTKQAGWAYELRLDSVAFDRMMGRALQVTPEKTAKAGGGGKKRRKQGRAAPASS